MVDARSVTTPPRRKVDLRSVESAVTLLAKDRNAMTLIVKEYFDNGAAATLSLTKTLLVRKGLQAPDATCGAACILTGVVAVMMYVNDKRGEEPR